MPESATIDMHATRHYGPVIPRRLVPVLPKPRKHVHLTYNVEEGQGQRWATENTARAEITYLADNECKHGSLPTDPVVECWCWEPAMWGAMSV